MKKTISIFLSFAFCILLSSEIQSQNSRQRLSLDEGWRFFQGDIAFPIISGHDMSYDRIINNWKLDGQKFTMEVTIPANTTANVYVSDNNADQVTESSKPALKAADVRLLQMEKNATVNTVASRACWFQSELPEAKK